MVIFTAISVVLWLLEPMVVMAQETKYYVEQTADEVVTLRSWEQPVADGYILRSEADTGDVHIVAANRALETLWWQFLSSERSISYQARREGDQIVVEGELDGETVQAEFPIPDAPWYQSVEKSLEPFVLSGRERIRFMVIQPYDVEPFVMVARARETETVEAGDETYEAVHVVVSPEGFASLFYRVHYWFRASDGLFVRYEGTRGPPGTPKTVVELQGEADGVSGATPP
jgi:hypothetical protein